MSSKTPKQARFMAIVAHDPKAAKRVGVSQSVGKEFNQADKGTGIIKSVKKNLNSAKPKLKFNPPAPMLGTKKKD